MKIGAYLQNEKEEIPQWLKRFGKGSRFRFGEAHGGRIVYYPAPWLNGHAIKTFNRAGYAHVFLLADRDCDEATVSAEMRKADGFDGALTMTVRVHICPLVTEDSLDADAESFVRARPFGYRIYWQDQIVQSDEDGRVIGWKPCVSPPPFRTRVRFQERGTFFKVPGRMVL